MSIFTDVKSAVDIKTAASHYGLNVRNDMACCVFHNEKTPSMRLYPDHIHCFGCSEHGDVIKLTGQILGLSPIDSARRLATDFNVMTHDDYAGSTHTYHSTRQEITRTPTPNEIESSAYRLLCRYCDYLEHNRIAYAPLTPEGTLHPLFIEAVHNFELYRYYKELFINESFDDRMKFICNNADLFDRITQELSSSRAA